MGGHQGRGPPPEVAPDQDGATAPRLGPRVLAAAPALPYGIGIPGRQVPLGMTAVTGVRLTPGALTPDARRRAVGTGGLADEPLRARVPATPVVPPDDPGWRVGGEPAPLMAVETTAATVSQLRPRPRHEDGQDVIPADDAGVMVPDRGRRDDAQAVDRVEPHKGRAHLRRALRDVVARTRGRARECGEPRKAVRQDALARWHRHRDGPVADVKVEAEARQAELP